VLHPVLVRQPDVVDADAVGRGLRNRGDDALHHRVVGVEVAHVVAQDTLRARDVLAVRAARVEVEAVGALSLRARFGAGEGGEQQRRGDGGDEQAGVSLHVSEANFLFPVRCVKDSAILTRGRHDSQILSRAPRAERT
jgi:hypothetical protein